MGGSEIATKSSGHQLPTQCSLLIPLVPLCWETREDSQDLWEEISHRQKESGAQDASWRNVHKTQTQNTGVGLLTEEETNPYYVKEVGFGGSLLRQPGSLHKTDLNCPFNDL